MLASEIIAKARFTLSDGDGLRWSDTRLLSLLNDGIIDFALTSRVYNENGYVKLQQNKSNYDISSFAVKIERVEYLQCPLELLSFSEMDKTYGKDWQTETGDEPEAIVYDLKRHGEFVVYPIPTLGYSDLSMVSSEYGIITGLNYEDVEITLDSDVSFGDVNSPQLEDYLHVYYVRTPTEITSIDDELDETIDKIEASSLAHYVSGHALRDNFDAQNRSMGNEELSLYMSKKQAQITEKEKGNMRRIRETSYSPLT